MCSELEWFYEQVRLKKSPRLLLEAPPRHGKSELVSRRFPAWALGKNPNLGIIATSYALDLASRMNRDVQRIIDSPEYQAIFPGTRLSGKGVKGVDGAFMRNNDLFEVINCKGSYRAAGIGGGVTGMGADILLIDDPVKDAEQAGSKAWRDKTWDWYTSTAYTRLMPGGGILLILTRWNEDDLAGRILSYGSTTDAPAKNAKEHWRVVKYPAIAEQDEKYRKRGEPLHPERYSLEQLERIKEAVGTRVWVSLYQQNPSPTEGAKFKRDWWRFWKEPGQPDVQQRPDGCSGAAARPLPEAFDEIVESWDLTFKGAVENDWVVGVKVGRKGARKYVLDLIRRHTGFGGAKAAIAELRAREPWCGETLVEDKANGPAVIEDLGGMLTGVVAVNPQGGKEARAAVLEPQVEAGNWFLPDGAHWLGEFIEEFAVFPNGKHDDQVDAVSQAAIRLSEASDVAIAQALCQF